MSKIDLETEAVLRKVLYAAIKGDDASFEDQLESFTSGEALLLASARAADIAAAIIAEQYKGRPSSEMISRLANFSASANGEWSGVTASDFAALINAIIDGTPLDGVLSAGVAIRAPFILGGQLMMQFKPQGSTGFDYLDHIWEILEARSGE